MKNGVSGAAARAGVAWGAEAGETRGRSWGLEGFRQERKWYEPPSARVNAGPRPEPGAESGIIGLQPAGGCAENRGVMREFLASFGWLDGVTLVVPLAAVALGLLLARLARRSQREARRLRAGELFRLLGARVAGRVPARALRRAVSHAAHEPFWDALEALASTLRMRERLELARTLARSG